MICGHLPCPVFTFQNRNLSFKKLRLTGFNLDSHVGMRENSKFAVSAGFGMRGFAFLSVLDAASRRLTHRGMLFVRSFVRRRLYVQSYDRSRNLQQQE
jgi:hypothetical protein